MNTRQQRSLQRILTRHSDTVTERPTEQLNENLVGDNKTEHGEATTYVIEKVVSHGQADDTHSTTKAGENPYHVRWYGYEPMGDMWEPIIKFPRGKVLSYYHRRSEKLPTDIDRTKTGWRNIRQQTTKMKVLRHFWEGSGVDSD